MLAGTTPPALAVDELPAHKDGGPGRRRLAGKRAPPVTLTRLAYAVVLASGWRRADNRLPRRRRIGAGAGADQCLADPVPDLSGAGLAGGRLRRRTLERHHGGGGRRLVLRLRLFPRRTLLDRLRLPGRRQDLRLAAAGGGRGPAGLSRALHRLGRSRGAADLGARAGARAGAGRHAHRARNGCAAICSADFPGTLSAMRSPSRWRWRKAFR